MLRSTLLVTALAAMMAFAGCIGGADTQSVDEPISSEDDNQNFTLEGHQTFCDSEENCDFFDEQYHEYVVYNLDTTHFDVAIIPPEGPSPMEGAEAARKAVEAWGEGILNMSAPWLRDNFTMNVSVVGVDVPSLDAVQDPEIVVISSQAAFLVGIGLEPVQFGCEVFGQKSLQSYPVHSHGDAKVVAENCAGTGFTCFAINVGAIELNSFYDLVAHEVGHCLGAGHVGDALDFRAQYAPVEDIMSYQNNPEQVHCVSNLNVRTLEGVYAHLLDQPEDMWLPSGSFYHMEPVEYTQMTCENP